jgi:exodeoxyribonuclease-3
MKITSWNVNSIKARGEHVQRFLKDSAPDVLMVQELKGLDFPADTFEALGYHTHAVTQKAYNGVAIFSKTPVTIIHEALPGKDADEQARYLEFDIETENGPLRLINIYLPNGNPLTDDDGAPHEKFTYKLEWMTRLYNRLKALRDSNTPFAIGGDFNIIPTDADCYDPTKWENDAATDPKSRALYRSYINLGLTEAFRALDPRAGQFTFWDYQAGAWQKDNGIRIDHFLLSPEIADRLTACTIDIAPRGWEKPSDHTPITLEIDL